MPAKLPLIKIAPRKYCSGKGFSRLERLGNISIRLLAFCLQVSAIIGLAFSYISEDTFVSSLSVAKGQHAVPFKPLEILTPVKVVGHGTLSDLDWSKDGSQMAIASSLGLYFYDPLNLRETNHIDAENWILQVKFGRKGESLATIDRIGGVTVWKIQGQPYLLKHIKLSDFAGSPIRTLALRDDFGILAIGRGPAALQLIDLNLGITISRVNLPDFPDTCQIEALAFSPDGKVLAVDAGYNVYLVNPSNGAIQGILPGDHDIHHLAFSLAGPWLAVDNAIYSLQDGSRKQVFRAFSPANIQSITYSPDGQILAINTGDKINLVDIVTGRVHQKLFANGTNIRSLRFSPDGRKVAAATEDDRLWIWEVITGDVLMSTDAFTGPVLDVDFSPDGNRFASITSDHIWIGDARESSIKETLPSPTGTLTHLAFNPNNLMLATAGDWLRLWNINATILHHELVGHTARVNAIAFSPDGRYLATAGSDHTVRIWNTEAPIWVNGNDFSRTSMADLPVNIDFLSFSPDGSRLAGGSRSSSYIYLWDTRNGMPLLTLNGPVGGVTSLRFSPDSSLLAVSGIGFRRTNSLLTPFRRSHAAFVWNVTSGELIASLGTPGSSARLIVFNRDGNTMLCDCLGSEQALGLWRVRTSEENSSNPLQVLPPIHPHDPAGVTDVVFSPNGNLLAIALLNGQIEIWGTEKRILLYNLIGHRGLINAMDFRPDGKMLLSGGQDGILAFWDLP
jgi:WD40 repeat protein